MNEPLSTSPVRRIAPVERAGRATTSRNPMRPSAPLRQLSLFVLVLAIAAPAVRAATVSARSAPQQETPPARVDKRPEVAALIDEYEKHLAKKGPEDKEAIGVIDKMNQAFKDSGPKDRDAIVKSIGKVFEIKRIEKEGVPPDNKIFLTAAGVLGYMGPESSKVLMQWIDHKDYRKDKELQRTLMRALGKTKDKAGLKTLYLSLENKEPAIVGGAAEALGEFSTSDQDTRKDVFEHMLKVLMSTYGNKDQNPNDTVAQERWDVVGAPLISSCKKVAKLEESKPEELQRWWNKNKKANWDEEK
jgi:hypothetical protein